MALNVLVQVPPSFEAFQAGSTDMLLLRIYIHGGRGQVG